RVHDVYHRDLSAGEMKRVAKNAGDIIGWVTEAKLKVRGAVGATRDGGSELLVRASEDADWEKLIAWSADDMLSSAPLCCSLDGQFIYLEDTRNANASRLVKMNITSGDLTVIAEDPHFDIGSVIIHP